MPMGDGEHTGGIIHRREEEDNGAMLLLMMIYMCHFINNAQGGKTTE